MGSSTCWSSGSPPPPPPAPRVCRGGRGGGGGGGAAAKLKPGEKLAKEQHFRFGGGSYYQQDPASHDFNKDLYCGGVPSLWAGLMKCNVNFEPVPYVAEKVASNKDGSVWTFTIR